MQNRYIFAIFMILLGGLAPTFETQAQNLTPNAVDWIERPWEYRYLIYSETTREWSRSRNQFAKDLLESPKDTGKYGQPLLVHFDPQFVLATDALPDRQLGILRLDIQTDRSIVQPALSGAHLRASLNSLMKIVLTPTDTAPDYIVKFGYFFMGAYGASDTSYSPAICNQLFADSVPIDGMGRYKADFPPGREGYFGCREWAAQLYDKNRPYIDVSSYEMIEDDDAPKKKGKPVMKPISYIRPFVGFSRFDSPLKPIIGNHKGTWYCITDCPVGDQVGVIPDIKTWAAKKGWSVPTKPKNVRQFMDKPVTTEEFEE